jgi:hypothetical protein
LYGAVERCGSNLRVRPADKVGAERQSGMPARIEVLSKKTFSIAGFDASNAFNRQAAWCLSAH